MSTSKMSGMRKLISGMFGTKGLSREEVEKVRARGGKIVYGLRKVGEVANGIIIQDMAGKPYFVDKSTGVMTRNFEKPFQTHREKSRMKRHIKFGRVTDVLDYFKMPYRYMKQHEPNHPVFTRKGLVMFERLVEDHKAAQVASIKKVRKPRAKKVVEAVEV